MNIYLEVTFIPFQKGQGKNSHSGLNMGSKLDIEEVQHLEVHLFSLNELKALDWILFSAHDLVLSAFHLYWNSSGTSKSCGSSRATSSHCLEGGKILLALTPSNWKGKNTIFFIVGFSCVKDAFLPWSSPGPADSLAGYYLSHLS